MPLYTLWETGTRNKIVFAAVHCTDGRWSVTSAAMYCDTCGGDLVGTTVVMVR